MEEAKNIADPVKAEAHRMNSNQYRLSKQVSEESRKAALIINIIHPSCNKATPLVAVGGDLS